MKGLEGERCGKCVEKAPVDLLRRGGGVHPPLRGRLHWILPLEVGRLIEKEEVFLCLVEKEKMREEKDVYTLVEGGGRERKG